MTLSKRDPWADNAASLRTFPDHVLVDIARNDAAQHDYRKLATEVLWNRKSPRIQHPDLQPFVRELEIELEGVIFDHPAPGNPLIASITTESMSREDVLPALQSEMAVPDSEAEEASAEVPSPSQAFTGFDEVQLVDRLDVILKSDIKESAAVPTETEPPLPTESTHAEIQEKADAP